MFKQQIHLPTIIISSTNFRVGIHPYRNYEPVCNTVWIDDYPEQEKLFDELKRRYNLACLRKDKREMTQFAKEIKIANSI